MKVRQTFSRAERFPQQLGYSTNFTTACLSGFVNKGPTFPRGQRSTILRDNFPGPGQYMREEKQSAIAIVQQPYKVNKEFLDYMRSRPKSVQQRYPGPGAYEIPSTLRKRGCSFTRARGLSFLSSTPGPADYIISRAISKMSN